MDLTIFALSNVAGYWIYGPLWGSFSCYTHKCTQTVLLAYLPLISCHWMKDLGGTHWTDWCSRAPHRFFQLPGPTHGVSCWVFLWCLTSGTWARDFLSMPAAMPWGQGKPPGIWEVDAKSRKPWDKKTSRTSCPESNPIEEPPHIPWSQCLWQRWLQTGQNEKTKNTSKSFFFRVIGVPWWFISQWYSVTSIDGKL